MCALSGTPYDSNRLSIDTRSPFVYAYAMESFDFLPLPVLTVTALTSYLRELLESDEVLQDLWVKGEISNLSRPSSGHIYFTLKDANSQLRCVMWKQSAWRLPFTPRDGLAVEVHGSISIYAASGTVQLYVDEMRQAGEGALFQQFLELKQKLESEGLFDPAHKRPLPSLPRHIGVITSPSGAAIQDILNTLSRRLPILRLTLAPTAVQGVDAVPGILKAFETLNALPDLDLIILARGGGSIEDLWSFNDEQVARAIFNARVPVISGIGHETDFTIADFVADLRAATPTQAAEMATPITISDLKLKLQDINLYLQDKIASNLDEKQSQIKMANLELKRFSPKQRVQNALQRQDDLAERLSRAMQAHLQRSQLRLQALKSRIDNLSPLTILSRGYAIVSDAATGQILRRTAQAAHGQAVNIRLRDGTLPAQITGKTGAQP